MQIQNYVRRMLRHLIGLLRANQFRLLMAARSLVRWRWSRWLRFCFNLMQTCPTHATSVMVGTRGTMISVTYLIENAVFSPRLSRDSAGFQGMEQMNNTTRTPECISATNNDLIFIPLLFFFLLYFAPTLHQFQPFGFVKLTWAGDGKNFIQLLARTAPALGRANVFNRHPILQMVPRRPS